ncbi:MAG TPA: hypothetical protein GXZ32_02835 [Clostridiales bacterium]|nr:hypothetical protein [Clostridiales bacterium]
MDTCDYRDKRGDKVRCKKSDSWALDIEEVKEKWFCGDCDIPEKINDKNACPHLNVKRDMCREGSQNIWTCSKNPGVYKETFDELYNLYCSRCTSV